MFIPAAMSENDASRSGSERKCDDAPLAQTSSNWLLELHRRCFSCCNVVLRQEALLRHGHDRTMVRALEDMLCTTQIYVSMQRVVDYCCTPATIVWPHRGWIQQGDGRGGQHAEKDRSSCISAIGLSVLCLSLDSHFVPNH